MRRKKCSPKVVWGVAIGGVVLAGTVAAIALSGGGEGAVANGYQILPNCQGLVINNEAQALEHARALARGTLNPDAIMEALFGKCGFGATTTPAFVPTGRFVFLAVRAVYSELVKKGYSVQEAAQRVTAAATNLTKMGVNLGDIPMGLEP